MGILTHKNAHTNEYLAISESHLTILTHVEAFIIRMLTYVIGLATWHSTTELKIGSKW